MKKIKLTNGKYATVDDEDFPYLSRFRWICSTDQQPVREIINYKKRYIIDMADFVIQRPNRAVVFYKNGNHYDLRKENIGFSSYSIKVNRSRKRIGTTSKYKGVSWGGDSKNKPWLVYVSIYPSKTLYVGSYATEKDGALAYNEKAFELYGEYAYQNKLE